MLGFDDPRWGALAGGYRFPYDPRPALRRLAADWRDEVAWAELWEDLHHQGDIGEASYAAVPALVDLARRVPERGWQFYALAATIETERHARRNPPLPGWLAPAYGRAWADLLSLALDELRSTADPLVVQSALAAVALAKGATGLGAMIAHLDASELAESLDRAVAWSERYRDDLGPPARASGASPSRPAD